VINSTKPEQLIELKDFFDWRESAEDSQNLLAPTIYTRLSSHKQWQHPKFVRYWDPTGRLIGTQKIVRDKEPMHTGAVRACTGRTGDVLYMLMSLW